MITDFLTNASECNPSGDLRAVHYGIKTKAVVLVIAAECPVTNFGKDRTGEIDTEHALDLPHQVGANAEPADFATNCRVERFVKIVPATQPKIGIEPVILSRDTLMQLCLQRVRKMVRDLRLGRGDDS